MANWFRRLRVRLFGPNARERRALRRLQETLDDLPIVVTTPRRTRGPLEDTPITWGLLNDGRFMLSGVIGGIPRQIIGKDREQLERMAAQMAAGNG